MKSLAFAFLAGLLSALGFAPLGLWPLTLAAVGLLLWLVETAPRLRSALARGWWFGLGQFTLGLNWIATAFTYQAAMPAWLGWIAVVLLSLYLAVFPAVAAGLAWRWGRKSGLAFILLFAAAWIVTEWLRATLFTGFAWNPLGVVLIDTAAARLAFSIGTYGLSGVAILFGGAAFLVLGDIARKRAAAITVLAVFVTSGLAWLAAPRSLPGTGAPIRIVQPDIGEDDRLQLVYDAQSAARYAQLTGTPTNSARLVLWPEAAVPLYPGSNPEARTRLASLLGPHDVLLSGTMTPEAESGGYLTEAFNSLFAIDGRGRILGRYDKAHLVPWGEYLPMRPLMSAIGLSALAAGDGDFLSGPGPRTIALPGFGRAGLQICYEIVFSGEVVDRANRPDFIFNPSNDAWFGGWGPPQHLAQARLRALEEGLPILRATPTGISAVIDAEGNVLQSMPLGTAGVIDARLPRPARPTLFARFGNLLPFAFALLMIAAAIAVQRKSR